MKLIHFSAYDDTHVIIADETADSPRSVNVHARTITFEVLAPTANFSSPWDRLFVVGTLIDKLPGRHTLWAFGIAPAFDCPIPPWLASYRLSMASNYCTHSSVLTLEVPDNAMIEI